MKKVDKVDKDYRIMIVDDERIVRDAIASPGVWKEYPVSVVKAASNAIEALEYIEEHEVDLVLTDIKMPVMDGIQLIRRVRTCRPETEFIILSGYAEFSYAQEALRYGARDYLLKPLDEETLVSIVLKCAQEKKNKTFMDEIHRTPAFAGKSPGDPSKNCYSQTIMKIMDVVDAEIANQELSLKWISANKLFLNENYLSKLFQKEVKQKFTLYLLERRMFLAMRMLANDPDALVQNVAQETGFGDNPQYFSITFKKYTGYTPTEYKKYIRGGTPVK